MLMHLQLQHERARTMHLNLYYYYLLVAVAIRVVSARTHHYSFDDVPFKTEAINNNVNDIIAEEPVKTTVVDAPTGIHYNPYSKQHPGRHVCTLQKNLTVPIKTKETYCKPVYKKYVERCHDNQQCTGIRLIYETAFKDVVTSKTTKHVTFICCPGWLQVGNRSHGCNKPVCNTKCQNGGTCIKPGLCKCLKGFAGQYCETDVDECMEQKPCDQICQNTYGSFKCQCRENFVLENDGQTCRKEGSDSSPGLEAKDLEYELLDKRLYKLERMFATETSNQNLNNEINKLNRNVNDISKEVNYLRHKLEEMEKYKNDFAFLKRKVEQLEDKTSSFNEEPIKYKKLKPRIFGSTNYI